MANKFFDTLIILIILVSGLGLAIDNPLNDPAGKERKIVTYIDQITSYAFTIEAFIKIIVFGLVANGRSSYLRNIWNLLDFLIVVFSILSMTPLPQSLKYFKLLRIARPLRLISSNKNL